MRLRDAFKLFRNIPYVDWSMCSDNYSPIFQPAMIKEKSVDDK